MNTRKFKLNGMFLALFLSVLTMSAVAQQAGPRCANGSGNQACQRIPDLSDEQDAKITKLRTEHIKTMNVLKADLGILKAELSKLEIAESTDKKAIDSKIDEIFAVKSKMAKQASQHRQEVRSLLTDDQKVFFDAHSCKGQGKGHGPHQGGGKKCCPKS